MAGAFEAHRQLTTAALPLSLSRPFLRRASDERLVEHLSRGSEAAFEVMFDRHHAALLSFCRHLLGSLEEAEDAVQQTFLSAYRQLQVPERRIRRLKPWLFVIARNRCLSILRGRRETTLAELPEQISVTGPAELVEEREELGHMLAALAEIPFEQRTALLMMEAGALSHEQIAIALKCETSKVKSLVYQARSTLSSRREERRTPCEEFRKEIALGGAALRRGPLRRHLKACPDCRAFRDEVGRQRALLALALPVIPTPGFRDSVLAAAASMGGGGGPAGGLAIGAAAGKAATAGGGAAAGGGAVGGSAAAGGGVLGGGAAGAGFGGVALLAKGASAVQLAAVTAVAAGGALGAGMVVKDVYERDTGQGGSGETPGNDNGGGNGNGPGQGGPGDRHGEAGNEPPGEEGSRGRSARAGEDGGPPDEPGDPERSEPGDHRGAGGDDTRGPDGGDSSDPSDGGGERGGGQDDSSDGHSGPEPPDPSDRLDLPDVKDDDSDDRDKSDSGGSDKPKLPDKPDLP